MKIKLIFNSRFAKLINVGAITLYPFIFFADDKQTALEQHIVAHEYVHVVQIRTLGWWRFYWTYLVEYFKARFAGKNDNDAYYSVSYEVQAYAMQDVIEVPKGFV